MKLRSSVRAFAGVGLYLLAPCLVATGVLATGVVASGCSATGTGPGGPGGDSNGDGLTGGDGSDGDGTGGDEPIAPTLGNGQPNPLAGERPSETEELPTVEPYAGGLDGFVPGRGPGLDGNFSGRPECREACEDFPLQPIVEIANPPVNPQIFEQASQGAGPCIVEPQDGVLIPANWTRPRVRFTGVGANNQHQIVVSAEQEANDLVVYTRQNPWIMPAEIWDGLRKNVYEQDITITVRTSDGGAPSESSTRFRIAPVLAGGSIVFWGSSSQAPGLDAQGNDTSALLGFSPGDEAVISTLTPSQVQGTILDDQPTPKRAQFGMEAGQVRCVGCHTSTPDGEAVSITDHWPWNNKVVRIDGDVGGRPEYMTDVGDLLTQMPWQGMSTYSTGDWATGARRVITSYEGRGITQPGFTIDPYYPQGAIYPNPADVPDELAWIDLAAPALDPDPLTTPDPTTGVLQEDQAIARVMINAKGLGWDVLARTGDPGSAVAPDWSHDGSRVAYTSASAAGGQRATADGHLELPNRADIYTVPFNDGAGGAAAPVPGASSPDFFEYYPDFSADDEFIAFNRVPQASAQGQQIYYRPEGEIYSVRAEGGEPIRMAANDPPACTGQAGNAVYNSWPKWSPVVRQSVSGELYSGRTYYFYSFASARQYPGSFQIGGGQNGAQPRLSSQLYLATLVVDNVTGNVETYPALYLWNQNFVTEDGTSSEPRQLSNLTPAWDEFVVPPIVVVIQ